MRPQVGSVLAKVGAIRFQGDRFFPITTEDEEGATSLYLPARLDFGLVIQAALDTVWVAPLLTADNLPNGTFDRVWNDSHDPDFHWGYLLEPIRGHLDEPSVAALYAPTVLGVALLDFLGSQIVYLLPEQEVRDGLVSRFIASVTRQQP